MGLAAISDASSGHFKEVAARFCQKHSIMLVS